MIQINDITNKLPRHPTKKYKFRELNMIDKIVIHTTDMDTSIENIAKYDISPGNHISKTGCPAYTYHFTVMKSGEIFKCLELEEISWHVGIHNPTSLGISLMYQASNDFNKKDDGSNTPTDDQLNESIKLSAALALRLALEPKNVVGHRELKGTGWVLFKGSKRLRKTCPGLGVNMDSFRFAVAKSMQRTLLYLGLYNDKIDGIFGKNSKDALQILHDELHGRPFNKVTINEIRNKYGKV